MLPLIGVLIAGALTAAALTAAAPGPGPAKPAATPWTWSLYESATMVTLAHEAPDTNLLGPVLECSLGSGQVKVTVNAESPAKPAERVSMTVAARDPAFQAFLTTGRLTLRTEALTASITTPPSAKEKLARFGKLCGP